MLDIENSSPNSCELKRLREKSYEVASKNLIIQNCLDDSTWDQIMEHVSWHERQIGFIKKSQLQGKAFWDELGNSSSNFFKKIFGAIKQQLENKGVMFPESEGHVGDVIADALTYIHIQTSGLLPEQEPQYDGKEGCAGGICYTLRNMQAKVWWKLCVVTMFQYDTAFVLFYKSLGNSDDAFETFVRGNPAMLFNSMSTLFVKRLHETFSWGKFHLLLKDLKDENGRTFIYHETNPEVLVEFYTSAHRPDLYQLLSETDKNGQTALHHNPSGLSKFLIYSFSPPGSKTSKLFLQLLDIKDKNNKTAIDYGNDVDRARLSWLADQARTGCYALYRPSVALLFNTVNRTDAGREAYSMFRALEAIHAGAYRYENFDEDSLFEAIDEAAGKTRTALIVFLMAHGSMGTVHDVKGKDVSLLSIQNKMCSFEHLKEKPKILIVQCCQQGQLQHQLLSSSRNDTKPSSKHKRFIPNKDHFCAYMSCVEGQAVQRNVFIPALAEKIQTSDKTTSLHDIFEQVKVQLAEGGHINTPILHSTLHGKVCLKNIF